MKDYEFDKKFRKKLDQGNTDIPFDEDAWDAMNEKLDAFTPAGSTGFTVSALKKWAAVFLPALITLGIGCLYVYHSKQENDKHFETLKKHNVELKDEIQSLKELIQNKEYEKNLLSEVPKSQTIENTDHAAVEKDVKKKDSNLSPKVSTKSIRGKADKDRGAYKIADKPIKSADIEPGAIAKKEKFSETESNKTESNKVSALSESVDRRSEGFSTASVKPVKKDEQSGAVSSEEGNFPEKESSFEKRDSFDKNDESVNKTSSGKESKEIFVTAQTSKEEEKAKNWLSDLKPLKTEFKLPSLSELPPFIPITEYAEKNESPEVRETLGSVSSEKRRRRGGYRIYLGAEVLKLGRTVHDLEEAYAIEWGLGLRSQLRISDRISIDASLRSYYMSYEIEDAVEQLWYDDFIYHYPGSPRRFTEVPDHIGVRTYGADLDLSLRYRFLKASNRVRPYLEGGINLRGRFTQEFEYSYALFDPLDIDDRDYYDFQLQPEYNADFGFSDIRLAVGAEARIAKRFVWYGAFVWQPGLMPQGFEDQYFNSGTGFNTGILWRLR